MDKESTIESLEKDQVRLYKDLDEIKQDVKDIKIVVGTLAVTSARMDNAEKLILEIQKAIMVMTDRLFGNDGAITKIRDEVAERKPQVLDMQQRIRRIEDDNSALEKTAKRQTWALIFAVIGGLLSVGYSLVLK